MFALCRDKTRDAHSKMARILVSLTTIVSQHLRLPCRIITNGALAFFVCSKELPLSCEAHLKRRFLDK